MIPGSTDLQELQKKMSQADSILRIAQRTAACHDSSLYLDELSSAIDSAIDYICECRKLCSTQKSDL